MASLRFEVTYMRSVLNRPSVTEMVTREIFAPGWDAAEAAATRLPRFVELRNTRRLLPETTAERVARIARENSGPVPYGC